MVKSHHSNISKGRIRSYRFGFNGKEKLNEQYGEGNAYDFGARIYDPRIGRWLSRDPLESTFPSWSTYNFSLNSPIRFNDPDGKGPTKRYSYDFATGYLTELSNEGGDEIDFIEFHNVPQEYIDEYNKNHGTNFTNTSFEVSISVDSRSVTVANYPFNDMDDGYFGGERGPGYLIDYGIGEQPLESALNDPTYFMPQTYSWRAIVAIAGRKSLQNIGAVKSSKGTEKFETKRAAFRGAKRDAGIPTSQTHTTHKKHNKADDMGGKGTDYEFGDGKTIQNHPEGHTYKDGGKFKESHFNNHPSTKKHYTYPSKGSTTNSSNTKTK